MYCDRRADLARDDAGNSQPYRDESILPPGPRKKRRNPIGTRPAGSKPAAARLSRSALATEDVFPPLSTSLDAFLKERSDRKFRNLIYDILSLSTLMLRAREHFANYIGVTAPQYSMMVVIAEAGKATTGQVAAALHVSSSFVTAEIGKLMRRDIIRKTPSEADRRSALLTLTPYGCALIVKVGPIRRLGNDMIFGSLSAMQAKQLTALVQTLLADAQRALHALDAPEWRPEYKSEEGREALRPVRRLRGR